MAHRGQSEDPILKARRERNRQAQNDFRQRRLIAERAQEARIDYLEDVVEQLSGIIVRIYDDISGLEEVVGQPRMVSQLQQSLSQALRLSTEALGTEARPPGRSVEQGVLDTVQRPNGTGQALPGSTDNRKEASLDVIGGNRTSSQLPIKGSTKNISLDFVAPFIQNLSPFGDWIPLGANAKPLAVRLAETALLWACSVLGGQTTTSRSEYDRMFSDTLRRRPQAEILSRLQWVIGPGHGNILMPAGMNWEVTSSGEPRQLQTYSWAPSSLSLDDGQSYGEPTNNGGSNQRRMLTAIEVSSQLEKLGAHFVGKDTMELCFKAEENLQLASVLSNTPRSSLVASKVIRVRLDAAFLARSLALAGTCLDSGPAFPRAEIGRAVKASATMTWSE